MSELQQREFELLEMQHQTGEELAAVSEREDRSRVELEEGVRRREEEGRQFRYCLGRLAELAGGEGEVEELLAEVEGRMRELAVQLQEKIGDCEELETKLTQKDTLQLRLTEEYA